MRDRKCGTVTATVTATDAIRVHVAFVRGGVAMRVNRVYLTQVYLFRNHVCVSLVCLGYVVPAERRADAL